MGKGKFFFGLTVLILALAMGAAVGGYVAIKKDVPSIDEIKGYKPSNGTRVYADDDTLIGEFKIEKGIYVPLSKIPDSLIKAVIATEDSRFWSHNGLDYIAILRALAKDILAGGIREGGSTITQQLAKVVFLTPERTIKRKLKEAALALKIERNLTKKDILELYLNKVYFGHGAYGVQMASMTYFGKPVSELNTAETALLAGLIRAPSIYSPYNDLEKAKERQYTVLKRMQEQGYLTKLQVDNAYRQPLHLASLRAGIEAPNYFLEYIRNYLEDKYGTEVVYKGGMRVYTTLNRKMQAAAVNALQEGLREVDKRQGFRGPIGHKDLKSEAADHTLSVPISSVVMTQRDLMNGTVLKVSPKEAVIKAGGITGFLSINDAQWASRLIDNNGRLIKEFKRFRLTDILKRGDIIKVRLKGMKGKNAFFSLEQEPQVEGAIVAIEPATGYIRAMVGGYNFSTSSYNRAVYAKRQPGSAFKPIIYAAAMDNGFTPASIIVDEPVSYPGGLLGEWKPENYDHQYYGPTRLRDGLAYSRNIVTVKLLDKIGVDKVINLAKAFGFEGPFPHDLTLALGSLSVTPLQMASAFSAFDNGGIKMYPIAIKSIKDAKGNVIEDNHIDGVEAIDPDAAFLTTSMMESVVNYGTGQRAKAIGRPVAGKTGTTNNYKDAWFVGFTPELTATVWVGFDDMRSLGPMETGARAASPIWVSFMENALTGSEDFPVPDGIVTTNIDPDTGLLAQPDSTNKILEYFKAGTQPKDYSTAAPPATGKASPPNLDMLRKNLGETLNID